MNKILILGSKGMLGQELVRVFKDPHPNPLPKGEEVSSYSHEVVAWDREDIDATDFVQLEERIIQEWPDVIFNAIAYNAVDACEESEEEFEMAKILNTELPGELARIAKGLDTILVHYSTDYVFDGKKFEKYLEKDVNGKSIYSSIYFEENSLGYTEDDMPNPVSRYGMTKYQGEQEVAKNAEKYFIIRLSKLFGKSAQGEGAKRSFFDVMLEQGIAPQNTAESTQKNADNTNAQRKPALSRQESASEAVQVVDGEVSNFTYAPDLAKASRELIESEFDYGVYHLSNEGAVTWFEACQELYKQTGVKTKIKPVSPDTFPRPAKRPSFSVLKNTKFRKLRPYEQALREYLNN
jgi:dTDP-4-dehydrorhamnose reductase